MQSHEATHQKVPSNMHLNKINFHPDDLILLKKGSPNGFWWVDCQNSYQLTDKFIQKLCHELTENTTFQYAAFNDFETSHFKIHWSPKHARDIGHAIKNHPVLKKIHIEFGKDEARPEVIIHFLQCLTGSAPITSLYLLLHEDVRENFLNELGKIFAKNQSLKKIRIVCLHVHPSCLTTSLEEFVKGLMQIPSLEEVDFQNFNFSSENLPILSKIPFLKKLTLAPLSCDADSMLILSEVLKKSQNLEFLDISGNLFNNLDCKVLADTLPFLPRLKFLVINNIFSDIEDSVAFDYLTKIIKEYHLRIESLEIVHTERHSYSSQGIKDLISDNHYLKELYLGYLAAEHIEECIPVLANAKKCYLQKFDFLCDFSAENYSAMITAMQFNRHLLLCPSNYKEVESELIETRLSNIKFAKAQFIEQSKELANAYYSKRTAKIGLANLPLDILYLILKMAWNPKEVYLTSKDLQFYHLLHLQNFSMRRYWIEEKKYHPKSHKDVHAWWLPEIKSHQEINALLQNGASENSSMLRKACGFFNTMVDTVAKNVSFRRMVKR